MNEKYLKYINTLFVVFPMTLIMAFVGIVRNHGFEPDLFSKALNIWMVMFPVAYLSAFIIIPVAGKLTRRLNAKAE